MWSVQCTCKGEGRSGHSRRMCVQNNSVSFYFTVTLSNCHSFNAVTHTHTHELQRQVAHQNSLPYISWGLLNIILQDLINHWEHHLDHPTTSAPAITLRESPCSPIPIPSNSLQEASICSTHEPCGCPLGLLP